MKESELTAPVIFGALFVACTATAAATGLVFRKLENKLQPKYRYPSAEDSELYKF